MTYFVVIDILNNRTLFVIDDLVSKHGSYRFSSKPIPFKVVIYRLYHNIADSRQQ